MKRGVLLGLMLLASAGFLQADPAAPKAAKNVREVVKIGVLLPLTGALSDVGQDTRDAMLLYMSEHSAGRFQLIFEDDQSLPRFAASGAQKLINVDKVQALVSFYGYGGHAVAPIAENAKVLHMGLTLDRDVAKGAYSYANEPSPENGARRLVEGLKKLGYTKVSVLYVRSQGPLKLVGALKKECEGVGIEVKEISVLSEERDLRPVIAKLEANASQVWVMINYPPQSDIFLRQCKQLGIKTPMTALWSFDYVQEKPLVEGLWYVRAPLPTAEFALAFKSKYGHEIMPIAIYGHEGIKFLAEAFGEERDAVEAKAYLDSLKSAEGIGGRYSVDELGFFDSEYIFAMYKNGKLMEIKLEDIK